MLLPYASLAQPDTPAPLTTLRAVHELSNAEASKGWPVAAQATVTYFRGYEHTLFVQDGDVVMYVYTNTGAKLAPGDRILIYGKTHGDFHSDIVSERIVMLHHGPEPKAVPATFSQLIRGQLDCVPVTLHAVIRAANVTWSGVAPVRNIALEMITEGGPVNATVDGDRQDQLDGLLDDEVEITGIAGGEFDDKMQQTGVLLHVSSIADIKVIKHAATNFQNLPVTAISRILNDYRVSDSTPRIRIQGAITYYQPGSAIVLQGGGTSLWIDTQTDAPLHIGDLADVTGFPAVNDGSLTLSHGEVKDREIQAPISPLPVAWRDLAVNGDLRVGHHDDLVSIEGEILTEAREGAQDEYVLVADGHPFSAIFRHPGGKLPTMRQIPIGSRVRVTGICTLHSADPFKGPVAFDILLRSFDDIQVVKSPSLMNVRNLVLMICLLLVTVAIALVRGWLLERRVRRQSSATARFERRRSRILEDINASLPLPETLERITEMIAAKMRTGYCWCELADTPVIGTAPPKGHRLRVISQEISVRNGAPPGTLFAARSPRTKPSTEEHEILTAGTRLAALSIETRRLYTDLLHRSEFDLLTDIHNRFSFDKHVERQIHEAKQNAGIFGVIYIDLDKFKAVNDEYGHQAGDLYLQQVVLRMKHQLRAHDLLARQGGDEFAVLVSAVYDRGEVKEIAQRLERCFDETFAIGEFRLRGSASIGIAMYPEDADTVDGLLSAADAEMYAAKHTRSSGRTMTPVT
jgi:diguanylate cyclase (GGDEF)-like protein